MKKMHADSTPPPPPLGLVAYRYRPVCAACGNRHGFFVRCEGVFRFCWRCGQDLEPEIRHRFANAIQQTREVTQDWWEARGGYKTHRDVERVLEARKPKESDR